MGKEADAAASGDASTASVELASDSDEQLLLKISFREKVKLLAIAILGPPKHAPKSVSLFVNNQVLLFSYSFFFPHFFLITALEYYFLGC